MDDLRWILLTVGALVVAGIYGFTRWQESRRAKGRRGRGERVDDVDIDQALKGLDDLAPEQDPVTLGRDDGVELGEVRVRPATPPPAKAEARAPAAQAPATAEPQAEPHGGEEKVIVLSVAATDGRLFPGADLVAALEAVGLRYGEHQIYHRLLDTKHGPVSLFSAANILKPGTFDPAALADMESPGIALFLQLPGPYDGLAAFEQMLDAGRKLADRLGVRLLDGRRCTLSNQAVEAIREELREYRRLAHLAAKKSV